ncbi:MAG TPA: hypothetical protein VFN51_02230 [Candidatus Saccharimonadales bacterium]|nr:hypothetical protein [Candidatus Saccharimonadales bacterium]
MALRTPDDRIRGSFILGKLSGGYEALTALPNATDAPVSFRPNDAYEQYLKMHKVFVGKEGAKQLEDIHFRLQEESMPRYLSVAGWAAAEAALIETDSSTSHRLGLLASSMSCWHRSLQAQAQLNTLSSDYLKDYTLPYRTALDIAVLPLLEDVVFGDVKSNTCDKVFQDCLNIAQANAVRIRLMDKENDVQGLGEHVGLGYEINALLALNRRRSPTWFAIPSMNRSDSGYYHRQQTHDLLVIHQKRGEILDMAPVEVKSTAGVRERERYRALIVRGKLHLSVNGMHRPGQVLEALTADEEGRASRRELKLVGDISDRFIAMVRDYYRGKKLGHVATDRSLTNFHDASVVAARHPGFGAVVD